MLVKELKDINIGETLEGAVIKGCKIIPFKYRTRYYNYANQCEITKLNAKGVVFEKFYVEDVSRNNHTHSDLGWRYNRKLFFPNKEDAYRFLIGKLRKQRQEINKKMIDAQMACFGKRVNLDE